MRNKNDMYIDYERSYKKHSRRRNRSWKVILIIFLAVGLGLATYFGVRAQMNSIEKKPQNTDDIKGEAETDITAKNTTDDQDQIIVSTEDQPKDQVTVAPTMLPTPTVAVQVTQDNITAPEEDTRVPVKVKGIYVTAPVAGSDLIDKLVELTDTTEINTMVIDVKDDHGKISYAMDSAMAQEIGAVSNTISDMAALVNRLKEKNIYLIARIVAFKDPYLAEIRQDLAIKNQDGTIYRDNNGEGWVNPYNQKVWEYLVEVAGQAAAIGFHEIQFDYIRFSTGGGINQADFGVEAETKSKEEIIIEFTKYAYERIKPLGVFVSADVYGTIISSSIDAGLVGQNYVEMSKYLDYICPMIYPSHFGEGNYGIEYPDLEPFNIIRKVLVASKTKLEQIPEGEHRAIVRPWLQDFTASWIKHYMAYGGPELKEQINGVYTAGYEEWLLWNASCNYSEDGLILE
jgi:hypothetical protein